MAQRWGDETLRIDYDVASNSRILAVKRTLQDHVTVLDMLGRYCEVTKRVERERVQAVHPESAEPRSGYCDDGVDSPCAIRAAGNV